MLRELGEIPYQECNGRYRRVREIIEKTTSNNAVQDRIYRLLFKHGGRCDCTVDRNVVRIPERLADVEEKIGKLLNGSDAGF